MALIVAVGTECVATIKDLWNTYGPGDPYVKYRVQFGDNLPPGIVTAEYGQSLAGTFTTAGEFAILLEKTDASYNVISTHPIPVTVTPDGNTPDPEPPTDPAALATAVARFLGKGEDPTTLTLAAEHTPIVTAFVRAYTRGNGFVNGEPNQDLRHVIVVATARLVVNPEQSVRITIADYSETPAILNGFTLPELMVLNLYRRRTSWGEGRRDGGA